MIKILCIVLLMLLSLFATFRVTDMDWRKTFWPELFGYVLVCIAAFSKGCIMIFQSYNPALRAYHDEASLMLYAGAVLILWTITCNRLRRRATDKNRAAIGAACGRAADDEEHRVA